jgi:ribonuclease HI
MCGSKIQKRSFEHEDFLAIFVDLMRFLDQEDLERVAVVTRALWFRRNAQVHGRQIGPPHIVVGQALESLEAFQQATSRQRPQVVANSPTVHRWQVPPAGFVKVNWDAAVDGTHRRMGMGVIVRDPNGEVVAMLSAPRNYITAPDIAEAVAALKAVTFCRELGFSKVILEGDALQVVNALKASTRNWSPYGHLIEEAHSQLSGMHTWRVNHVRRHLNGAAHQLAKAALTLNEELIYGEEVPLCISDIISMERL